MYVEVNPNITIIIIILFTSSIFYGMIRQQTDICCLVLEKGGQTHMRNIINIIFIVFVHYKPLRSSPNPWSGIRKNILSYITGRHVKGCDNHGPPHSQLPSSLNTWLSTSWRTQSLWILWTVFLRGSLLLWDMLKILWSLVLQVLTKLLRIF